MYWLIDLFICNFIQSKSQIVGYTKQFVKEIDVTLLFKLYNHIE